MLIKEEGVLQAATERIKELYVCRYDAFVEQYSSEGKAAYRKIDRSLFDRDIGDHIIGKKTYAAYMINRDNRCRAITYDIDVPKGAEINAESLKSARNIALELVISLMELGIGRDQVAIEDSGRRGYHVWVSFQDEIPSWQAYSFAKLILEKSKVSCEYFPKQAQIGEDSFGSAIRLPLGVHRATNRRSQFLDEEFNPYSAQLEYLQHIQQVPVSVIQDILSRHNISLDQPVASRSNTGTEDSMDSNLTEKGGSVENLIKKCRCLQDLIKKAKDESHLTNDERLFVGNIFAFLGDDGEKKIHEIIGGCSDYDALHTQGVIDDINKKAYKPITCRWLKEKGICRHNCKLRAKTGTSPSPIQLCFPGGIASESFEAESNGPESISLKAENNLTFNISSFGEYKGGIWARVEAHNVAGLIYSDSITISSGKSRAQYANKLLKMLNDKATDRILIEKYLMEIDRILRIRISEKLNKKNDEEESLPEMTEEEKEEAMNFLKNPNILDEVEQDVTAIGHIGEWVNKILIFLAAISRLLTHPLSCVVKAVSSAGKNALVGSVLKLIPPEVKVVISRATPNSLFYVAKNGLKHKILYMAEKTGADEADYSIRSLISEGKLTVFVPIKNPHTGIIETKELNVEGPTAYIETTTAMHINEENDTRMLTITIDEGEEQTRLIHDAQRKQKTLDGLLSEDIICRIIRKHHNAQRLLKKIKVVIPYAQHIEFPSDRVRTRRDHSKFLSLIEATAVLRQYQKEIKMHDGIEYIEADMMDYELAYGLISAILGQTMDEVSPRSRSLLEIINYMVDSWLTDGTKSFECANNEKGKARANIVFVRRDLRKYANGFSDSAIHASLKELSHYELLKIVDGKQGRTYKYTVIDEDAEDGKLGSRMLTPEELQVKWGSSTSPKLF